MKQLLPKLVTDESAQGLVEYALIASLLAIAAVAALTFLGSKISNILNTLGNSF